jgi:hypothetical protein
VKFPGKFYDDVIIDVMPTIDVPDVFITKVKSVKVGSSLYLTGNTKPVMDYGRPELQTPVCKLWILLPRYMYIFLLT